MPKITVISGANTYSDLYFEDEPTIGELKDEVGTMCSVDDDCDAVVNGEKRSDDYTLRNNDTVTFRKATGTKG